MFVTEPEWNRFRRSAVALVPQGATGVTVDGATAVPYLTTPSGAAKLTAVFPRLGDANDDGRVDIADVTAIIRSIGGTTPATFNTKMADANHDGTIGMADVNAVISIISQPHKHTQR